MVYYEVIVYTGNCKDATTFNDVFIKLVGVDHDSKRTMLKNPDLTSPFSQGETSRFSVSCDTKLGHLACIELDKQPTDLFPVDTWFVDKVEVKSSEGYTYIFPIYSWIADAEVHWFCEASGSWRSSQEKTNVVEKHKRVFDVFRYFSTKKSEDLNQRKKNYSWAVYQEGLPYCINADKPTDLHPEMWFSYTKDVEFLRTAGKALVELNLRGLVDKKQRWTDFDDMSRVFYNKSTPLSDYVKDHWKDDEFFGYQFLNGSNPMKIRHCTVLPTNFPVPADIILHGQKSLEDEIKKGNIFLCDYKNFDGVKANIIDGKQQYLMAPLVLLQRTEDDKMMPVAIQLKQKTEKDADNPIFYYTDSAYDWLLAKIFVRSADFNEHELNYHLLHTHLLAEVFIVSLMRNVSAEHPLYKVLMPHTRYTLHINVLGRKQLISQEGIFAKYIASGGEAMTTILKRSLSSLTYSSLCIKDNITERGLESVPNFYYRDDGFALWDIIHSFVKGMIKYHYNNDDDVMRDDEIQNWIKDIFEHGFLSQESSGIPQNFTNVEELVKLVTMVIFTCSAQHSAVNTGQFDYYGWMPNSPPSLQCPPPTIKGKANEDTVLQTLPNVSTTVSVMATVWLLSQQSFDFVQLGHYKEHYFTEEIPCKLIKDFQRELQDLSANIKLRNDPLKVPYTYMDPQLMENSVSI